MSKITKSEILGLKYLFDSNLIMLNEYKRLYSKDIKKEYLISDSVLFLSAEGYFISNLYNAKYIKLKDPHSILHNDLFWDVALTFEGLMAVENLEKNINSNLSNVSISNSNVFINSNNISINEKENLEELKKYIEEIITDNPDFLELKGLLEDLLKVLSKDAVNKRTLKSLLTEIRNSILDFGLMEKTLNISGSIASILSYLGL